MTAERHAGKTLLVVEDNEVTRQELTLTLSREGYTVVAVGDGRQALEHLRSNPPPDLILLDMLMPVLDGWHFLEQLKNEGPRPAVPIVITTGTILTREWAQSYGCAGFLAKPVETRALLEEVRRCCSGRPDEASLPLRAPQG